MLNLPDVQTSKLTPNSTPKNITITREFAPTNKHDNELRMKAIRLLLPGLENPADARRGPASVAGAEKPAPPELLKR